VKHHPLIAVASRSFSQHSTLTKELRGIYQNVRLNSAGSALAGQLLIEHLRDADRAVIALEHIDDSILKELPKLEVISKFGVGYDNLDLDALRRHNVKLGWTGGVNKRAVAELALNLMMACLRGTFISRDLALAGTWQQVRGRQLSGRVVGIIGFGHVGQDLAKLLQSFGCRILVNDVVDVGAEARMLGAECVTKEQIFSESNIVSLHTPLTSATSHLIDRSVLKTMRSDAIIINTARGGLIEEADLEKALLDGHIAAAACDVFEVEPPIRESLFQLPNFIPTTHIGGSSEEAVLAMGRAAILGLDSAVDATPDNLL
jgi:phosphoglycerate dehydrogenase-like enzyme